MPSITPRNAAAWRRWLERNHARHTEVWVTYIKAQFGRSMTWSEAVDEALCFGWIDGVVQPVDAKHYRQRFTPRKPKSRWSLVNKKKIAALIEAGKMTAAGLQEVERAQQNGEWERAYSSTAGDPMPDELTQALEGDALTMYRSLAPGYQALYRRYVADAKRAETRRRRAEQSAQWLRKGIKSPWAPKS